MRVVLLLLIVFMSSPESTLASDADIDIRYRSIIYFYPGTKDIDTSVLPNLFNDFDVVDKLPNISDKPVLSYSVIKEFKDSYPVPDLDYLAYFGRGMVKEEAVRIQDSNLALIIDIAYPIKMSYQVMRSASSSLFNYAQINNGLIWDSETRELFTPQAWKTKRVDSWGRNIPTMEDHTVIHAYKNNDGVRAITLGMAKFGLPDILVNDFSWSLNRSMGNLINLVAQSLIEGVTPNNQGIIELNIDNLKETEYKKELISSLKDNAQSKIEIELGEGKWEEGDPNNYLVEILFNNVKGNSLSERHDNLLSSLFGWEDQISYVEHNLLIKAASNRAKQKLDSLKQDFNSGLNPGEFILVKAPFSTPDGGNEWMWVEVLSWKGETIFGLLKNEPYHIPDLKGGSEVSVKQEDVFDYIRNYPDGSSEGNETGALIMKYQK